MATVNFSTNASTAASFLQNSGEVVNRADRAWIYFAFSRRIHIRSLTAAGAKPFVFPGQV
jgi:hypothetical protein